MDVTRTATADDAPQPTPWPIHIAAALEVRDPARYEVLGEHGRGGIGRVLRAYDKQLGRSVAIKELIKRGGINEVRFAREAMITARLEHPGIVPVHDAGRWPDGTPFYVMKLVAGRSLKELIDERRTLDERLGLLHHVIAVANAVAYAHGRGIIHRDLKPSNVIVGELGETVVIDWGLAKELHDGNDEPLRTVAHVELTDAGSVVGTPMYMSPEQTRGDYVDQRTDVYAIGAMLWELCSFARVPAAAAAQKNRLTRDARIPPDLVAIIMRALAFDPAARYRDAGELAVSASSSR